MKHALAICTRNRLGELLETLESIDAQSRDMDFSVTVIDGSDDDIAVRMESECQSASRFRVNYIRYPGQPSLARQRNHAVDVIAEEADVIHFLDDDVTLAPDYLVQMDKAFAENTEAAGVGPTVIEEGRSLLPPRFSFLMRLFLLFSDKPGQVLISGHETPAQSLQLSHTVAVEWLNGCAAYRRAVFDEFRFADILEGYSLDEDLDFSYRVSRKKRLIVFPQASMLHRRSSDNRLPGEKYFHDYLVHRYWFTTRNMPPVGGRTSFWWSTVGRLLRATIGRSENRHAIVSGYLNGVRTILRKDHYLLTNQEEV